VQRHLVVFVAAHAPVHGRRIPQHDPPDFVWEVERNGREDVVSCAAAFEKIRDSPVCGVVATVPTCGPADHLELMIIPLADHIAAGVSQPPNDLQMRGGRGPMHRVRVVSLLARVDVQASPEQQIHDAEVSASCGGMKERPLVGPGAGLYPVWMLVEQRRQALEASVSSGIEQLTVEAQRVDVRFEGPPAREAVAARNLELRVGQLSVRVRAAEFFMMPLRLLAEPIEVGMLGERFGHDGPSFLRKGGPFRTARCPRLGRGTEGY
jgi:hypothetical protein